MMLLLVDDPGERYVSFQEQPNNVSGKVLVEMQSQTTIRGVLLKFKGKATVISDSDSDNCTNKKHERFFKNNLYLFGGPTENVSLRPGEHFFPFDIVLPPNLPSSYEGKHHGYIRYKLKAILVRPLLVDNKCKRLLKVVSPLDLNYYPIAMAPVRLTDEKYFGCCCCKSGPMSLVVSLPTTGYVPGDVIPLTVEVDNNSNVDVTNIVGKLKMVTTFHMSKREKYREKKTICQLSFGFVSRRGSKSTTKYFSIPYDSYYNLIPSKIIDAEYSICVKVKTHGTFSNLSVCIPLTIGTEPFARQTGQRQSIINVY